MLLTALEQEIVEKFRQLDQAAKARVRETIEEEVAKESTTPPFDVEAWLADMDKLRFTPKPDENGYIRTAADWVNEAREERDAEILRSLGFRDSDGDSAG